jgi:excisionase family DNA binding protein
MKQDKHPVPKLGWTVEELARSLSVSVPFLRLEIKRGKLRATHLGRRVVLFDNEVRRYLAEADSVICSPRLAQSMRERVRT